ncbi:lysosome-associated membrane glycoprotein 2 isoform X2 [Tiliqua scincoides]|uniref:lysosome-associated membrane glycoprotein 2 isoform X2 n=1 Tax=Tiliqua scincoides TaxID=71010 RepID=UPI00346189CB
MESRCSLLGPLCCASLLLLLLLLEGSVVFQTYAVDVEVKDEDNITCLIAKWKMNFSVPYESRTNEYKDASFTLPSDLTYHGSTCGNKTYGPVLAIQFGEGNSWTITFEKTENSYQGNIAFIYNTDDANLFPDAKRKGPVTAFVSYPDHSIPLNTTFSCQSVTSVEGDNVVQTFWNVTLQAYVENGALSEIISQCHDDKIGAAATTTAATTTTTKTAATIVVVVAATTPTTATTTTMAKTSVNTTAAIGNTTTVATTASTTSAVTSATVSTTSEMVTTTNVTTAAPHPLPTVAPGEKPTTGNYSVKRNGTTCLLANMGLQLNISQNTEGRLIMNINPSTTVVSGSCGNKTAVLQLNDANTTMIAFIFAVTNENSGKFYLKEVNITVMDPFHKTQVHADNSSLDNWKAFMGSSYMCQRQQTLRLSQLFSINTFDVWVQPFLVKENAFATADECLLDDDAIIIPIAVGAALGVLIVLIVTAYIIGRRKSQVGYQTL